jgi:hypothetical protein
MKKGGGILKKIGFNHSGKLQEIADILAKFVDILTKLAALAKLLLQFFQ